MKRSIFLLIALLSMAVAIGQQSYKTVKDIKYYSETDYNKDSYKDSMCVLDLYYPEGVKDFATIVWFHGGGITGGHRDMPEQLKNKGYAIATVEYRLSPNVKAPVYIEDAAAAVAWVFEHIKNMAEMIILFSYQAIPLEHILFRWLP
ncbi:alpha/beta hydrolase fold domain-containing protein [Niabella ginsengisoli]|uniref:Alpha/beta hydrolase n=1 Tax=Niabella ginsengisoli TaxID=522298 RepID=A0ABS9SKQ4_9BACT|nr:alpha/beta hydrolase fold domain-containing protein [Niabella ginsengisoli]MCH5598964.1 alpha/beta hydrolase [Niabella ginsengisoli]